MENIYTLINSLLLILFVLISLRRGHQLKVALAYNQELQKMCDQLFNDPSELALPLSNKQWILIDANNGTIAECHSVEYAEQLVKIANRFILK